MLVTERPGRIRVIRNGTLEPTAIAGVPHVRTDGNGGLMDIALHPGFANNRLIYLTYTKPVENGRGTPTLARRRQDENRENRRRGEAREPRADVERSCEPTQGRECGGQRGARDRIDGNRTDAHKRDGQRYSGFGASRFRFIPQLS